MREMGTRVANQDKSRMILTKREDNNVLRLSQIIICL